MAGLFCVALTPEVALSLTSPATQGKTVLQVAAPTNQRLKIKGWSVSFDGVTSTNEPVLVTLERQTTSGTTTSLTPKKMVAGSETVQTTAGYNATAEPTSGDELDRMEIHPQGGYEKMIPMDQPIEVPGGGRVGIVCVVADSVNVVAKIIFEE